MTNQIAWHYAPLGEAALQIEAHNATLQANQAVLALSHMVGALALAGVETIVPAISSLLITFDPLIVAPGVLQSHIESLTFQISTTPEPLTRTLHIPVRYGGSDGPDLDALAAALGLKPQDVIALHCSQVYRVMMVGFAPGFPYIGLLPPALHVPRRATPRTAVPAGSVAIAAGLTGIYPARLPGGWHVIGRTERALFDPTAERPALLAAGDGVQFEPIDEPTP